MPGGMPAAMFGMYGGGHAPGDVLGTNLDAQKLSHPCPTFTLAACMAEAQCELYKALDALTAGSLEVEDD